MPTVQTAQLRQECRALLDYFDEPKTLAGEIGKLLEHYAARARRRGKVRRTGAVLNRYEAPQAVLRQLRLELLPHVQSQPKMGLALVDALWAQKALETRLLAIRLLGVLPKSTFRNVSKRVVDWAHENREEELLRELAERGTQALREQDSAALLKLAGRLFKKRELRSRATGLLTLKALLEHSRVANFPALLNLLTPLSQNPPKSLRPYLLELYAALIAHSPGEALYFLQQRLAENPGAGTRWVARQSLKFFPPEGRKALQEALDA